MSYLYSLAVLIYLGLQVGLFPEYFTGFAG